MPKRGVIYNGFVIQLSFIANNVTSRKHDPNNKKMNIVNMPEYMAKNPITCK